MVEVTVLEAREVTHIRIFDFNAYKNPVFIQVIVTREERINLGILELSRHIAHQLLSAADQLAETIKKENL